MEINFKQITALYTFILLLFLSNTLYATRMPGVGDYAGLISIIGIIAGFVFASVIVLIVFLVSRNKNKERKYFKIWIIILIVTPIAFLVIFFLLLFLFSL